MRNGIPLSYVVFRTGWSVMHLVLFAAAFALLAYGTRSLWMPLL